jgi:hypothetical protein
MIYILNGANKFNNVTMIIIIIIKEVFNFLEMDNLLLLLKKFTLIDIFQFLMNWMAILLQEQNI